MTNSEVKLLISIAKTNYTIGIKYKSPLTNKIGTIVDQEFSYDYHGIYLRVMLEDGHTYTHTYLFYDGAWGEILSNTINNNYQIY